MQACKTFSCDQRMGLLVTGLHLVCCWRYLSAALEGFESKGLHCLWEIWVTAMIAFAVGQIAKYFTPPEAQTALEDDLDLAVQSDQLSSSDASSRLHGVLPGQYKEGTELGVPQHGSTVQGGAKGQVVLQDGPGQDLDHELDDMTAMKRRAQEEAAAKLAKYRAEVHTLLASIRSSSSGSGSTTVDAQLLYRLADQLFASSINPCEFVEMGGVPVVLEAVRSLTCALGAPRSCQQQQQQYSSEIEEEPACQQQQEQQAGAMPAMLQASWVLLQLSHGSPACKVALQDPQCSSTLLAAAQAVQAVQDQQAVHPAAAAAAVHAAESILRNIWWTLLCMCDQTGSSRTSSDQQRGADAACTQQQQQPAAAAFQQQLYCQYEQYGAVPMLQQLLSLRHGLSAGWVAAAHLGLLLQLGHQDASRQQQQQGADPMQLDAAAAHKQQQQQQHEGLPQSVVARLSQASVQALLQEESVTGLVYLMTALRLEDQQQQQQQQQLSGRVRVLVEGLLHFLLTFQGPSLLQLLLEMRLLGSFATHSSPRLGRLLVCQLLSSKGQEVMAAVEEGYEVDVPLGLAQVIPLKVHVKVPAPPQQQQQQEGAAADGTSAANPPQQQQQQQASEDLYTDIMACRLLLQHERLGELLSAFCEELSTPPDPQQQAAAAAAAATNPVAAAALAAEHESSVVAAALGLLHHVMSRDLQLQTPQHVRGDAVSASASSSSRSLEEALAMPDTNGVYSRVLSGMVPADMLPSSSSSSTAGLTLPAAAAAAAAAASAAPAGEADPAVVVFEFGPQQRHSMSLASYRKVKKCGPLVASILVSVKPHVGGKAQPITVLAIPQFTHEANCWVLQCLERWVDTKTLAGFGVLQAAKLWVAADFLQVDDLQVACEDVIVAGFRADPQGNIPLAVELCARHVDSGGRLLRLLVQQLLKDVSSKYGSNAAAVAASSTQQQQQCQLQLLRVLLGQHAGLLLPVMHAELRDRLVTHCMLNAALDGEDPSDLVG